MKLHGLFTVEERGMSGNKDQREQFEGVMLLSLIVEGESTTQGMQAALETGNGKDVDSPASLEGIQP